MDLAALLPHLAEIRIERVDIRISELIVHATTRAVAASCPSCTRSSHRLHGSYLRRVADIPLGQRRVTIHLRVQRFRCQNPACPQQTFAAQPSMLVVPHARRSLALQALLRDLGLTLGGRPSARFADRRAIATSRM